MIEYRIFYDWVYGPDGKGQVRYKSFGNWFDAWKRFVHFWLCIGIFVVLDTKVDQWYMTRAEFRDEPFWYRCLFLSASMQVMMF